MIKSFFIMLFIIIVLLIIGTVTFLFLNTPYSFQKLDVVESGMTQHALTGEKVEIQRIGEPYVVKPSVRRQLHELFITITEKLRENNIGFWATKSTLLAIVRHGKTMPWCDTMDICINHEDLFKLVALRKSLDTEKTELLSRSHAYYFCRRNNTVQFPCVAINIMKKTDNEVSVCTPLSELSECTYADSFNKRREVFSNNLMFPLRESAIILDMGEEEEETQKVMIDIPHESEKCLDILYPDWRENIEQKSGVHLLNNYTAAAMRKLF